MFIVVLSTPRRVTTGAVIFVVDHGWRTALDGRYVELSLLVNLSMPQPWGRMDYSSRQ
ncbi:hypothetical protein [Pseudomonas floridensis]|uniref:hypothetical protein n=1 Tax=Pseudomonas floridensis TaxID=1958950 RepID=UPI0012FF7184|nr:hypothetical protein [Pseudomonas floridensis]